MARRQPPTGEIVAAALLPPFGVFLARGIAPTFWIALGLTMLFWLPGVAFALAAVLRPGLMPGR